MPEECTAFLTELLGVKAYQRLSSEEQIILGTAYLEDSVSNQRLQQLLDLHPTDIGKILSGLVDKKMLISEWKGRWTTYTINRDYQQLPEQMSIADVEESDLQLNATDQAIYHYIRSNGFITAKQVTTITKIGTVSGANVALRRLIKKGLVLMQGSSHNTYYVLAKARK